MSFWMLSEASDIVICYVSKKMLRTRNPTGRVWLLLPATITSPCFLLFFQHLRNTNRYLFVSQCRYFVLCGLTALNPHNLVPRAGGGGPWLHVCRRGGRRSAPCRVLTVTRLSPRSTGVGSVAGSSHQSPGQAADTPCKTEADRWQLELKARELKSQWRSQPSAARLT